jgi:hypothetical protein
MQKLGLTLLIASLTACLGPEPDPIPDPEPVACDAPVDTLSGSVSGAVCGDAVAVDETLEIAVGQTLTIGAGTTLNMAAGTAIRVDGDLVIEGTQASPVLIIGDSWRGISVNGTGSLTADYAFIQGQGAALGSSGELAMVDSTLDLTSGPNGPDCTSINGGNAVFDHVQFTNCHCPIHINAAVTATVTNSIFDGASVPVMLANAQATFRGNHFEGTSTLMLDIGGNIFADVGGNYWEGGAPDIGTSNPGQFLGAAEYSDVPFEDVGPR